MPTKRKAITERMKIDCLLYLAHWGVITCPECRCRILVGEKIQWDHRHALVHEGPHEHENLRPLHLDCHRAKTKRDIAAKAKGDRILGLTKNRPSRPIPSRPFAPGKRKIPSRPFQRAAT